MKKILIFCLGLLLSTTILAQNKAIGSDSIDVQNYKINLSITNLSSQSIYGYTEVVFTPKEDQLQYIPLDLLALNVDSVYYQGGKITTFTYNDTLLNIQLPAPIAISSIDSVKVFYSGNPVIDPSSWGGFYFSGDYAYNLGVGFQDDPHNYGRVWFPCIDDFVDKAYYDLNIITDTGKMAVCGGTLADSSMVTPGTVNWHWTLEDPISTYLVSVAVGPYVAYTDTFVGALGPVPIEIYVPSYLLSNAAGTFTNLKATLSAYESFYGPYRWERVGYVGVPFNYGAMEHATNIAYPLLVINGTTAYDDLMAHELSHHWFGDLVTCSSANEMWINEGWAVFSEFIFEEAIHGQDAAQNYIRDKHADVIKQAHFDDGAFYPVCDVPHDVTYGTTVYDKGGLMVHTLRHYMGDSLFFYTVQQYTNDYQWDNITCAEMRDYFSSVSGMSLSDFFDAWIFTEGFPHFSVDSFAAVQNGVNYDVTVYMLQKLYGRTTYANSNRIELSFMNDQWQEYTAIMEFSGQTGSQTFSVPFNPDFIVCDKYEKTTDAIVSYNAIRTGTGSVTFADAICAIEVTNYVDSIYFRAEHHRAEPDPVKNNSSIYRLSPNHYWTIDGIIPDGTTFTAQFDYNRVASANTGMIDTEFMPTATSADSLILVYRRDAADDWVMTTFSRIGNSNLGKLKASDGKAGQYCLAIGEPNQADITENTQNPNGISVYPNPSNAFTIEISDRSISEITIVDIQGRTVFSEKVEEGTNVLYWLPESPITQNFFIYAFDDNGQVMGMEKVVFTP